MSASPIKAVFHNHVIVRRMLDFLLQDAIDLRHIAEISPVFESELLWALKRDRRLVIRFRHIIPKPLALGELDDTQDEDDEEYMFSNSLKNEFVVNGMVCNSELAAINVEFIASRCGSALREVDIFGWDYFDLDFVRHFTHLTAFRVLWSYEKNSRYLYDPTRFTDVIIRNLRTIKELANPPIEVFRFIYEQKMRIHLDFLELDIFNIKWMDHGILEETYIHDSQEAFKELIRDLLRVRRLLLTNYDTTRYRECYVSFIQQCGVVECEFSRAYGKDCILRHDVEFFDELRSRNIVFPNVKKVTVYPHLRESVPELGIVLRSIFVNADAIAIPPQAT